MGNRPSKVIFCNSMNDLNARLRPADGNLGDPCNINVRGPWFEMHDFEMP